MIPQTHLRRLARDLQGHEQRLQHLRTQIGRMQDEAQAHERIVELGRDQAVLAALGELNDEPGLLDALQDDPKSFLEERGIDMPHAVRVNAQRTDDHLEVSLRIAEGPWEFSCIWDSATGFSLIHHQR